MQASSLKRSEEDDMAYFERQYQERVCDFIHYLKYKDFLLLKIIY